MMEITKRQCNHTLYNFILEPFSGKRVCERCGVSIQEYARRKAKTLMESIVPPATEGADNG